MSVVSHGHGAMVAALLDDLVRWRGPDDIVVVTLNVPEPVPLDRSRWSGAIEWIDNAMPKGFGANHNSALDGRGAQWFAIVNPDIRLPADALGTMIEFGQAASVDLVAPVVIDAEGHQQDSVRALLTPVTLVDRVLSRLLRRTPHRREQQPDWFAGMFLLVSRGAFVAVGGFDERFFLYCEDMDFNIRLRLRGFAMVQCETAVVVHDARRASYRSARHIRWHLASLARAWTSSSFWTYLAHRSRIRVGSVGDRGTGHLSPILACKHFESRSLHDNSRPPP